jgi:hypothetical protein
MSWSRLVSETVATVAGRYFGPLSLALKNTFPGNGDHECPETGSNVMLVCSKSSISRCGDRSARQTLPISARGRRSSIAAVTRSRSAHAIVVARAALLASVSTPPGRAAGAAGFREPLNRTEMGKPRITFAFRDNGKRTLSKPDVSNQPYNQ